MVNDFITFKIASIMKNLMLFMLILSKPVIAEEITLTNGGQKSIVPDGKVWIIEKASVADCQVCTSDVYIEGELSSVEIDGVIFHGNYEFSFSHDFNGGIKLYSGTTVSLGDTRPYLVIREQDDK